MARRNTATDAAGTVRQKGYAVVLKCFVPMGESIEAQIAALTALREVEAGDLTPLREIAAGDSIEVKVKATSRKVNAE